MLRAVGDDSSYSSSMNEPMTYENSPYTILLHSEALEQVKSIQLLPRNGSYEFNALVRISNDYRWHWITDYISDIDVIKRFINGIIDRHLTLFPEDEDLFLNWRRELNCLKDIDSRGISLMHEELH